MSSMSDVFLGDVTRWGAGFSLAALIAFAGFRTKSLSVSGALAAIATGGLLVGSGGWWAGFLLVSFFVSSSALSHANPAPDAADNVVRQARGHRRDAAQVLANGGVPTICAMVAFSATDPVPWLVGAASGIASATADTWATEIGRASSSPPRSILTGKPLAPGTSGAVSVVGTWGSVAGAVVIAALAASGTATGAWVDAPAPAVFAIVAVAGVAGALLDSLLGATVQGIWWCSACDEISESPRHRCGAAARLVRGTAFIDNDRVNALSIAGASAAGILLLSFAQ